MSTRDILVFPTKHESFPLIILEAMQFGIPVIATKEGAISEIVTDGETGILIDKDTPSQIAEKLQLLKNNPELCIKMGNKARLKYEQKYTIGHFERNLENVFNNILLEIV